MVEGVREAFRNRSSSISFLQIDPVILLTEHSNFQTMFTIDNTVDNRSTVLICEKNIVFRRVYGAVH
jgi:UDP-N-acetyl-D-mannosaminuronate dehydrogenase